MSLPSDYVERVYAGVLGKLIGVYLGRPIEGWTFEEISNRFGEVRGYVHQAFGRPLVVSDDDVSGTFTFLRALPEHGHSRDISSAQIGRTWLNQIIEQRTILWWGGMGNSTEHTAYLRLKHGIEAPMSGSKTLNSKVVSEQVGAQIFIDGWAMVAPGDPELAARLAERAARVSHDGEAVYAAQVLAVMESLAFIENDIDTLLDAGVSFIPQDAVIARMIADLREWHASWPRLALDPCAARGWLRLRQVRRQLSRRAESRFDHSWPAARQRRLSRIDDDREHLWLGYGLQRGKPRVFVGHPQWTAGVRGWTGLARTGGRPDVLART